MDKIQLIGLFVVILLLIVLIIEFNNDIEAIKKLNASIEERGCEAYLQSVIKNYGDSYKINFTTIENSQLKTTKINSNQLT